MEIWKSQEVMDLYIQYNDKISKSLCFKIIGFLCLSSRGTWLKFYDLACGAFGKASFSPLF